MKGATGDTNVDMNEWYLISIHAPVKGATTDIDECQRMLELISIHAPVKGATVSYSDMPACLARFQSTHP